MAKVLKVRNATNTGWDVVASSIPDVPDISTFATIEYVDNEISNIDLSSASAAAVSYLVDSAPATLDTLNELSQALNDDANFASTVTTALGNKLDISSASITYAPINSPTFTGQVTMTAPQINSNDQYNLGFGVESLNFITTSGNSNIAIGDYTLSTVTSGDQNIAIGVNSQYGVTGSYNVSVGHNSLTSLNNGSSNVAIGTNALVNLDANGGNTAVGSDALGLVDTGIDNTALGFYAGGSLDNDGSKNTFIGSYSGESFYSGNSNVIIGSNSGSSINGTNNNIIISDGDGNIRSKYLSADSGWTFEGSSTFNDVVINGKLSVSEILENVASASVSSQAVTLNYNDSNIFYINTPGSSFGVYLTNAPTNEGKTFTISIMVNQAAVGYRPNEFFINGNSQTIRWAGGSAPTPTSSSGKIDIYSFTIVRISGSWIVLATYSLNF